MDDYTELVRLGHEVEWLSREVAQLSVAAAWPHEPGTPPPDALWEQQVKDAIEEAVLGLRQRLQVAAEQRAAVESAAAEQWVAAERSSIDLRAAAAREAAADAWRAAVEAELQWERAAARRLRQHLEATQLVGTLANGAKFLAAEEWVGR
jgi:hypothetical protein